MIFGLAPIDVKCTRIKFCGITRPEDARSAAALGVHAVGLVFDAQSRRCVDLASAQRLREQLPPLITLVALFRDTAAAQIDAVLRELRPDLLQFHGDESPSDCERWQWPYIKAVPMGRPVALNHWLQRYDTARALLLDSHVPGELGGSGRAFDWSHAPRSFPRYWMLAGGLNPNNVADAVTIAAPDAVDVSSGIESAPGIKDPEKMRAFVAAVRRADEATEP